MFSGAVHSRKTIAQKRSGEGMKAIRVDLSDIVIHRNDDIYDNDDDDHYRVDHADYKICFQRAVPTNSYVRGREGVGIVRELGMIPAVPVSADGSDTGFAGWSTETSEDITFVSTWFVVIREGGSPTGAVVAYRPLQEAFDKSAGFTDAEGGMAPDHTKTSSGQVDMGDPTMAWVGPAAFLEFGVAVYSEYMHSAKLESGRFDAILDSEVIPMASPSPAEYPLLELGELFDGVSITRPDDDTIGVGELNGTVPEGCRVSIHARIAAGGPAAAYAGLEVCSRQYSKGASSPRSIGVDRGFKDVPLDIYAKIEGRGKSDYAECITSPVLVATALEPQVVEA